MKQEPTHRQLAQRAIDLLTRDPRYKEIAIFRQTIADADVAEDEGANSQNHFYDPDTGLGLPINTYTERFYPQTPETPKDGTRYISVLQWAEKDRPDHFDWQSAISNYDYTEASRRQAYTALGHVLHLVQDMGQPDHASDRPHPGNYASEVMAQLPKVLQDIRIRNDKVGFEALWALIAPDKTEQWPLGIAPRKVSSLKQAFDEMAHISKQTEKNLHLPEGNEIALGLEALDSETGLEKFLHGFLQQEGDYIRFDHGIGLNRHEIGMASNDDLWKKYETYIPLVPTILPPPVDTTFPTDPKTVKYLELGKELMPVVEEYSAGILKFFYDIVNPPPYVRSVEIYQRGELKYRMEWEDQIGKNGHVIGRTAKKEGDGVLEPAIPARVRITFGPSVNINNRPATKSVYVRKVWVEYDNGEQEEVQWASQHSLVTISVPYGYKEGFDDIEVTQQLPSFPTWTGVFSPLDGGTLVIDASDADNHFEERREKGDALDSDPSKPAHANAAPPYEWRDYAPGVDRNHHFGVGKECLEFWRNSRYGIFTGKHHEHFERHHGESEEDLSIEYDLKFDFKARWSRLAFDANMLFNHSLLKGNYTELCIFSEEIRLSVPYQYPEPSEYPRPIEVFSIGPIHFEKNGELTRSTIRLYLYSHLDKPNFHFRLDDEWDYAEIHEARLHNAAKANKRSEYLHKGHGYSYNSYTAPRPWDSHIGRPPVDFDMCETTASGDFKVSDSSNETHLSGSWNISLSPTDPPADTLLFANVPLGKLIMSRVLTTPPCSEEIVGLTMAAWVDDTLRQEIFAYTEEEGADWISDWIGRWATSFMNQVLNEFNPVQLRVKSSNNSPDTFPLNLDVSHDLHQEIDKAKTKLRQLDKPFVSLVEARRIWVFAQPEDEYTEKVRKLEQVVAQWIDEVQNFSESLAIKTDELVTIVKPIDAAAGEKLELLAIKLRSEGLQAFGIRVETSA